MIMSFDPARFAADLAPTSGLPVMDPTTISAAEADKLFVAIGPSALIGQVVLLNDLVYGLGSNDQVRAQQEAVEEVAAGGEFVELAADTIAKVSEDEQRMYKLLNGHYSDIEGTRLYRSAQRVSRAMSALGELAGSDSGALPETEVLRGVVGTLGQYKETKFASLLDDPLYFTPIGMRPKRDASFMPRLRFRPAMLTGRLAVPSALAFFSSINYLPIETRQEIAPLLMAPMMMSFFFALHEARH